MTTIYKYKLLVTDEQKIKIPIGAKILSIQLQFGEPCVWALVDDSLEMEERVFYTYGTGNPMDYFNQTFLGTYQLRDGILVFHVFYL